MMPCRCRETSLADVLSQHTVSPTDEVAGEKAAPVHPERPHCFGSACDQHFGNVFKGQEATSSGLVALARLRALSRRVLPGLRLLPSIDRKVLRVSRRLRSVALVTVWSNLIDAAFRTAPDG